MKRVGLPRLWSFFLCAVSPACANEAVLGDNSAAARGEQAGVALAPTVQGAIDGQSGPTRFDVSEERVISPTWRYDFDCGGELCARAPDLRIAPDGSVWAALLGGYLSLAPGRQGPVDTSEVVFVHLDESGRVLAEYRRSVTSSAVSEWGSPLLLDGEGRPYLLHWPTLSNRPYPPGRVIWLDGERMVERPLPGVIAKEDTTFITGFPDGSLLEFSMQKEVRAVRYSATGESLWRATDLRAVRQQVDESHSPAQPPVHLNDGSIVLDGLEKSGSTGLVSRGLTVLGPDGKLRWDMTHFLSDWPPPQLAAAPDAGLVLAGIHSIDADLGVFAYDRTGNLLRSFRGVRVGFNDVAPRALCSDQNGDIYVAVVVGERRRPLLSVCKLSMNDDVSPVCAALDTIAAERSENTVVYPFLNARMEVAAPGVLLFALAHGGGEDVITSIVRMDLDPTTALPALR